MTVPPKRSPRRARRLIAAVSVLSAAVLLAACGSSSGTGSGGQPGSATLTFGFQTADYPALLKASGLFENLPYQLRTPVISGPAAQISALYSKATDIGLVGENSAAFEAANAEQDWSKTGAVIQTIAGVSAPTSPYPAPSVFVRNSAGINSLADLRGKSVAFNFGGNIYAAYVKALAQAGLTINDIKPEQFADNQSAAAAFVSGRADAVVSQYTYVRTPVDQGQARRLVTNNDLGVAGGSGFITRKDVIADTAKVAAARDFFQRFQKFYSEWYPAHEADVEHIYQTVLNQSADTAKLNWQMTAPSRFYRVGDPAFIHREQLIVDAAFKAGGVKNERDVSAVFNPVFDPQTVP